MQALRRLYAQLHLRVNESKSAVAPVQERKFLGYTFWVSPKNEVRCTIARKALDMMWAVTENRGNLSRSAIQA